MNLKEKKTRKFLHLFSKFCDLCSWHLQSISCVLAAVNKTSNDFFYSKEPKMILKFQQYEYYRKDEKFPSNQNLQSKDFARASHFQPFSLISSAERPYIYNIIFFLSFVNMNLGVPNKLVVISNSYLIDGSQNTENETSHEPRW